MCEKRLKFIFVIVLKIFGLNFLIFWVCFILVFFVFFIMLVGFVFVFGVVVVLVLVWLGIIWLLWVFEMIGFFFGDVLIIFKGFVFKGYIWRVNFCIFFLKFVCLFICFMREKFKIFGMVIGVLVKFSMLFLERFCVLIILDVGMLYVIYFILYCYFYFISCLGIELFE